MIFVCQRCHGDGEVPYNPGYPDPQTLDYVRCGDCGGSGLLDDNEMPAQVAPAPAPGRRAPAGERFGKGALASQPSASSTPSTSAPPAAGHTGSAGQAARPAPAEPPHDAPGPAEGALNADAPNGCFQPDAGSGSAENVRAGTYPFMHRPRRLPGKSDAAARTRRS